MFLQTYMKLCLTEPDLWKKKKPKMALIEPIIVFLKLLKNLFIIFLHLV